MKLGELLEERSRLIREISDLLELRSQEFVEFADFPSEVRFEEITEQINQKRKELRDIKIKLIKCNLAAKAPGNPEIGNLMEINLKIAYLTQEIRVPKQSWGILLRKRSPSPTIPKTAEKRYHPTTDEKKKFELKYLVIRIIKTLENHSLGRIDTEPNFSLIAIAALPLPLRRQHSRIGNEFKKTKNPLLEMLLQDYDTIKIQSRIRA